MSRPKLDRPRFRLVLRGAVHYVRWWQDGRWQRISTRTGDRGEAARFLAQLEAGYGTPAPIAQPTISQVLDQYLAGRKPRVAAYATLELACKALRRHVGNLEPQHITRERSRIYARQRRAEGYLVGPVLNRRKKPVSDGTVIRELVTLRAALRNHGSPASVIASDLIETPRSPQPRDKWLTREQAARLIEEARLPHVRLFITLALYTAARRSAILSMQWSQVDLERGIIDLGAGSGNKKRAIVPIAPPLRTMLEEAIRGRTGPSVIEHAGVGVASVKNGFSSAAIRAGVAGTTPNVLRHTAATWMAIAGVPLGEIARFLGNSVAMVEKVYAKHSPEYLSGAVAALAGPGAGMGLLGPAAPKIPVDLSGWCCTTGLNCRPLPYQGSALPLS